MDEELKALMEEAQRNIAPAAPIQQGDTEVVPGGGQGGATLIRPAQPRAPAQVPNAPAAPVQGSGAGPELPPVQPLTMDNADEEGKQAALNRLFEEGKMRLEEQGVKYMPPVDQINAPEDQQTFVQFMNDMAAGFNLDVAKVLSLPSETVDQALKMIGLDYLDSGSPQKRTIDALNNMGIKAYEIDNLANKIGQGALPALATWAAIQVSAPALAAQQGTNTLALIGKQIGEFALKHPILGAWLGQTGQAGGKAAKDITGSESPLVEFGGEMLGSLAGGGVVGATKGAGKLAAKPVGAAVNAISDTLPPSMQAVVQRYNPFYKPPGAAQDPLITRKYNVADVQRFSEDQIIGGRMQQEKAIQDAIAAVPTTGDPAVIQARFHEKLLNAEKISKRIVSAYWARTPQKQRIPVNGLFKQLAGLKAELKDQSNQRPDEIIESLLKMSATVRDPNTGKFVKSTPTVQALRNQQSIIGTRITEEKAKDAPREGMIRNMVRVSEMIDDAIAAGLPGNTTIAQARAISRQHNDLFSRGPINEILTKRRTGDFRVTPSTSVDELLSLPEGMQAVRNIQTTLPGIAQPRQARFVPAAQRRAQAITPQEQQTIDAMVGDAEDAVRATFRQIADEDPIKGARFAGKTEPAVRALGRLSAELDHAQTKVMTAVANEKAIAKSELARFAETTPEKAVARLWADRDPARVASQLMVAFRGNKDALDGLRNTLLEELVFNRARQSPTRAQEILREQRYGDLMRTVLSPEQFRRLNTLVDNAVLIESGQAPRSARQKLTDWGTFTIVGRIFGAGVGTRVARMTGHGNIQTPGLIAQATGRTVERLFGKTDPADMFTISVLDPRWERLVNLRVVPSKLRDVRKLTRRYRALSAAIDTGRSQAMDAMNGEGDE